MQSNIHFLSFLAQLFLEWKILKVKFERNSKPTFYVQDFPFAKKMCRLLNNLEKHRAAGQTTVDIRE
jgi:hypothetical protein